jgi:hypothetical protein
MDWRNFCTVGIRGLGVFGSAPSRGGTGYQAWAVLPELRLHVPGDIAQAFFELGVGVGQLQSAGGGEREVTFLHGNPGLFLQGGLGLRAIVGPVTVTAEALMMLFTQVMGGNGAWIRPPTPEQETQKNSVPAVMFQLGIGWRAPR